MEIIVRKAELVRELHLVQGIVERKSSIPILSNVLAEARDGEVHLCVAVNPGGGSSEREDAVAGNIAPARISPMYDVSTGIGSMPAVSVSSFGSPSCQ